MDFGDRAVRTKILDAVGKGRIELRRINEVEKSALGVDSRGDGFDGDFFATGEHDSRNGAVFAQILLALGISRIWGASLLRGFGEGLREITKPATRKSRGADGMSI